MSRAAINFSSHGPAPVPSSCSSRSVFRLIVIIINHYYHYYTLNRSIFRLEVITNGRFSICTRPMRDSCILSQAVVVFPTLDTRGNRYEAPPLATNLEFAALRFMRVLDLQLAMFDRRA